MAATSIEMTPMLTIGEREASEGGLATPAAAAPSPRDATVDVKLPEPLAIEPAPTSYGQSSHNEGAGTIGAAGAVCGPVGLLQPVCALVKKARGHMVVVRRVLWALALALYVGYFVAAMYCAAVRSSEKAGFSFWNDEPTRRLLRTSC